MKCCLKVIFTFIWEHQVVKSFLEKNENIFSVEDSGEGWSSNKEDISYRPLVGDCQRSLIKEIVLFWFQANSIILLQSFIFEQPCRSSPDIKMWSILSAACEEGPGICALIMTLGSLFLIVVSLPLSLMFVVKVVQASTGRLKNKFQWL